VKIFCGATLREAFTSRRVELGSYVTGDILGCGANRRHLILLFGLGSVCLIGCGSDPAGEPTLPAADSGADATVRPPCPNPPIPEGELQNRAIGPSVFGMTVGGDPGWFDALGGTECGLPGVRICQLGTDTCTESDEVGQFVLGGLAEGQDIEIAFEKSGSTKVLRLVHTGTTPINLRQTRLITYESGRELVARAGTVLDPDKGMIAGGALAAGEGIGGLVLPEGVVMTLKPSGPAPLYSVGSKTPDGLSSDELDPALQATRFGGWGIFVNVDPGDYAVRFERNGQVCNQALPGYGYGADAEGNVRVKVVAGYSAGTIAAFCP
jgi:hypothetical protein